MEQAYLERYVHVVLCRYVVRNIVIDDQTKQTI